MADPPVAPPVLMPTLILEVIGELAVAGEVDEPCDLQRIELQIVQRDGSTSAPSGVQRRIRSWRAVLAAS